MDLLMDTLDAPPPAPSGEGKKVEFMPLVGLSDQSLTLSNELGMVWDLPRVSSGRDGGGVGSSEHLFPGAPPSQGSVADNDHCPPYHKHQRAAPSCADSGTPTNQALFYCFIFFFQGCGSSGTTFWWPRFGLWKHLKKTPAQQHFLIEFSPDHIVLWFKWIQCRLVKLHSDWIVCVIRERLGHVANFSRSLMGFHQLANTQNHRARFVNTSSVKFTLCQLGGDGHWAIWLKAKASSVVDNIGGIILTLIDNTLPQKKTETAFNEHKMQLKTH